MADQAPGFLAKLFPGGIVDYSGKNITVSLHTGDPAPKPDPSAFTARLFLLTANGEQVACTYDGGDWFSAPPGHAMIARGWEIWSEELGTIARGTFATPTVVDADGQDDGLTPPAGPAGT